MSTNKRRLSMLVGGMFCAALIVWTSGDGDKEPGVLAQQGNWTTPDAQRLGVRLLETRDPSGPPAYPVEAGDLLFLTNASTFYGSKNPKNSVVVINATTKKPIGMSDLDPTYSAKFGSHGIGVSLDGRYTYLPSMASEGSHLTAEYGTPQYTLVLDTRTLKIHQILATGGAPHHAKAFRDGLGRSRVLIEHFNWQTPASAGKGFFVVDPLDNNKVVAGMSTGELHGNPYSGFTTPDGNYLYYSVPPPNARELRPILAGWLAKINTETWKVVQSIPMGRYPIWTVFSNDGRWAWVTNSLDDKVLKIQRGTGPGERDKVVGEVATGIGPYGLRLSIDDKELWVADKAEARPTVGKSITVIDTEKNAVKAVIQTDCIRNDHIIMSPDGLEMWATCNESHDIVVLDSRTHAIKARIPMPNNGDSHGGIFIAYSRSGSDPVAEVVSDQNGLHGSALNAALKGTPWVPPARQQE